MVRPRALRVALIAAVLWPAACHAIAGVEDKELDPKYGSAGTGGLEAGLDAPEAEAATPESARPPARPVGWRGPSGKGVRRWFAARRVFLGSIDPASPPGAPVKDETAWQRIGHDLDGKCTTAEQSLSDASGVCKKPGGAPGESLQDGALCRDNAAGRLLAFGLQVLSKDFEINVHNKLISAASATFVLELTDLDDGPDDAYVPGALYVTVPTGVHPLWNGSDEFPIDESSIAPGEAGTEAGVDAGDPDAAAGGIPASRYAFPDGYMAGNVWVSDDFNQRAMQLPLFAFDRVILVDAAAITLELTLDAAHDTIEASTLSAVASKTAIEATFGPIAYEIVNCDALIASVMMGQYVLPAMDLANHPTSFVQPGASCDAMSFGFGFDWVAVREPQVVTVAPPEPPKCDGG